MGLPSHRCGVLPCGMRSFSRLRVALLALGFFVASGRAAHAQPIDPASVPEPLRPWVPWAVESVPTYGCTRAGAELVCTWPGLLELTVTGNDVGFALYVVVDRTRVVSLPGAIGHWPVDVREGTRDLVVVSGADGKPVVELPAGTHRIDGRIRFGQQPESIEVPADVARIVAIAGGARIPLTRASEGVVPLHGAALASEARGAESETDSVSLEIVRRVADGVPLAVDTQITARISGRARPIALGRALVAGTVPSAVSSSLPIQVTPEGDVLLQAQSGTHRIRISSFVGSPDAPLVAPRLPAPWPEQEIWLFAPSEAHRQVEITGPSSIDPQSPSIPEDWRSSAAYVLSAGERMTLVTRRRGEPERPPNALTLSREMWLDFDGRGFTVRDHVAGEMHRSERLDLVEGDLGRVTLGGIDQLITLAPGGPRRARGVEIRNATLDLQAEWRFRGTPTSVPAVAWSEDVRSLSVKLNLPPGYTLFAARGVDRAEAAWLEHWDVGPLFLVLLIAVVVARLFDKRAGLLALVTLVLIYFERDAPTFLWLFVLVPFAVLRLVTRGVFARLVFAAFALMGAVLVLASALFVTRQVRYAMHPQLLTEDVTGASFSDSSVEDVVMQAEEGMMGGSGLRGSRRYAPSSSYDGAETDAPAANTRLDNWIDPNAVVQTGHGLVDWHHTEIALTWTGPVAKDHRIHLYLVPPWMQRVLALARALGVLGLLVIIARKLPRFPPTAETGTPVAASPVAGAAITLALLACLTGASAHAQEPAPPNELSNVAPVEPAASVTSALDDPGSPLLAALRDRLVAPPLCGDRCARFGDAVLALDGDALRFEIVAHASVNAAVPLPGPATGFVPDAITLDGAPTHALRAGTDGHLWLRVPSGVHRVVMTASLAGRASIALSFLEVPGRVEVRATGWSVSGVDENGLVRGSLELRRDLTAAAPEPGTQGAMRATADVPTWVMVERHVELGVQWLVTTTLRRLSSTSGPAVVRLVALPGESVLGQEATRDGQFVVATLAQGLTELTFTSRIAQGDGVRFSLPDSPVPAAEVHRSETWSFTCSPLWHCTHEGIVPIHHTVEGVLRPTFAPYPGESMRVVATRLRAAPGSSFTFDGARLRVSPGSRASESVLDLEVRTSVSNTIRVTLPRRAQVQSVSVDGARRAVQVQNGTLSVGVVPSNRAVQVVFTEPHGVGFTTTTPAVRVGGETVDVLLTVDVPSSRWLLAAFGPDWGPIVLFWGHLVLVLLVAFVLGRAPKSPLATYEWGLLALGLTQLPLPATLVVAAWFFAVRLQHERRLSGTTFNVAQLALVLHAFVCACILVSAVWIGLNDRPDMQIVGNGSTSDQLRFYADRAKDALPTARFVSVSVWVWKGLMLVWAFWLASSVVRWALWAATPFRDGGFFAPRNPPAKVTEPEHPVPSSQTPPEDEMP